MTELQENTHKVNYSALKKKKKEITRHGKNQRMCLN